MSTCNHALDGFPNEILGIVAKHLPQTDLNSLCYVSKSLYCALNPLIWETVTIHAEDEWKLEYLDVGLLLRSYAYCPPQDHIQHVKNVVITAPIHKNIYYRCPHGPPDRGLPLSLVPFLQHLREGQLRSFSWNLGICMPCEVAPLFGPCGYVTSKQPNIESLYLITEGRCLWDADQSTPLGLQNLKKLQHLSWKGLRASKYVEDLRSVLECNADRLELLELDVVDWDKANDTWELEKGGALRWNNVVKGFVVEPIVAANFLAYNLLQLQPKGSRVIFPALVALSLSNISFDGAATELACAFNGNLLKSLKLQNCRGCASFLHALVDSAEGIRLRLFHLSMDDREPEEQYIPVRTFLEAFEGLEELGLLIKPGMATLYYWMSVTHHKSTLKRFVYHERLERERDNLFLDNHPAPERVGIAEHAYEAGFGEFLVELNLDCLAVCDDLASLQTRLELMDSRSSLKILHVRVSDADRDDMASVSNDDSTSGSGFDSRLERAVRRGLLAKGETMIFDHKVLGVPGLHTLASWAFGPNGLTNLQILAYGDFSYQGRYFEHTFVFRRNPNPHGPRELAFPSHGFDCGYYSLLQKKERRLVMAQYGEFLEACPVDSLVQLDRADMELV